MAHDRRTQILMEPGEYRRLRAIARRRKTSVSSLIREAVREAYLASATEKGPIVEAILSLQLPIQDWAEVRDELERGHAGLP